MNKKEQILIVKKETPEEKDQRISREIIGAMAEDIQRGAHVAKSSKKPSLDYYDRKPGKVEDDTEIPFYEV